MGNLLKRGLVAQSNTVWHIGLSSSLGSRKRRSIKPIANRYFEYLLECVDKRFSISIPFQRLFRGNIAFKYSTAQTLNRRDSQENPNTARANVPDGKSSVDDGRVAEEIKGLTSPELPAEELLVLPDGKFPGVVVSVVRGSPVVFDPPSGGHR